MADLVVRVINAQRERNQQHRVVGRPRRSSPLMQVCGERPKGQQRRRRRGECGAFLRKHSATITKQNGTQVPE